MTACPEEDAEHSPPPHSVQHMFYLRGKIVSSVVLLLVSGKKSLFTENGQIRNYCVHVRYKLMVSTMVPS